MSATLPMRTKPAIRTLLSIVCLVLALVWVSAASSQTVVENGLSIQRTITGIPLNSPYGLDVDPRTRIVYFIADAGQAIHLLRPDDSVEALVSGVGPFGDRDADLRLGPDGYLYAMGPSQGGVTGIERFMLDGQALEPELFVLAEQLSAWGLGFDCVGQLYLSDNTPEMLRVGSDGFITTFSEGWDDIDEIEKAPNNHLFVHHAQRDRVFLVNPEGVSSVYVQGLSNIRTGTYDWSNGDYLVADTVAGTIYRLSDNNLDNNIANNEISVVATGLGRISDITWGVSSHSGEIASIYVGNPELGRIIEITGLDAPNGGLINCGNLVDDDGDGWCDFGFDNNGDGDCEDDFEEQPRGDCDDTNANINPDVLDICDGLDNDCNFDTEDGVSDPLNQRPCDGDDEDLCIEGSFECVPEVGMVCNDDTDSTPDLCDGEDNDCNPDTPDGAGEEGFGEPCDGADEDLCPEGVLICNGEGPLSCSDDTDDTLDICDGLDNDCNPDTFDGIADPRFFEPCDGDDEDLCPEGTFSCTDGEPACDDNTGDNRDLCDGEDNDCNPDTPDGVDEADFGEPCDGDDEDLCPEGTFSCFGGQLFCDDATDDTLDLCDGEDNDCNPDTADGTGEPTFGDPCDGGDDDACPDGFVFCTGFNLACDDDEVSLVEVCNDGEDNDCDGNADDLDFDCRGSLDRDGDGFCADGEDFNNDGDCADEGENEGRVDCNDVSSSIHPDAEENCLDTQDNDCDDLFDLDDPDCERIVDGDDDGFCPDGTDLNDDGDCLDPGEDTGASDCNDTLVEINPDVEEVCDDGEDNDCDGDTDAQDADCPDFADRDGDGFCPTGLDLNEDGDCLDEGELTEDSDCDDTEAAINPDAEEICGDGADNDCNLTDDLDDPLCGDFVDNDGDGFCEQGEDRDDDGDCFDDREKREPFDCDDEVPTSNPDAEEICGDEADNDCDTLTDAEDDDCAENVDADGDGVCPVGIDNNGDGDCFDDGEAEADVADCNDAEPTVFGGNEEVCGDDEDNDCDTLTDAEDDDCAEFADQDNDDFCPSGRDLDDDGDCLDEGEQNGDADCNDDDIFIHQESRERCDDGIDNDCDGDIDLDDDDCEEPPADTDEDGVIDDEDNCPAAANPDQADADGDGTGDACDEDEDCACTSVQTPAKNPPWHLALALVVGFVALVRRRQS